MSRSNAEKWHRLQKLGRPRFVFRYGVLGFGLSTAVLFVLFQGYLYGTTTALFQAVPALLLFPLAGIVWGRFMWWFFEKYHSHTATSDVT
jgi:hypothetical protein